MADENTLSESTPDLATHNVTNGSSDTAPDASNLDMPIKDIVMADAAVDQAVRYSSFSNETRVSLTFCVVPSTCKCCSESCAAENRHTCSSIPCTLSTS